MRVMANLAQAYAYDELRISHEQNVILPHVRRDDLPEIFKVLKEAGLALQLRVQFLLHKNSQMLSKTLNYSRILVR